ncbi:hypothetical protein N0V84_010296 [Fusarium piperis]|uniref:Uncharacterized protein n=1 Tax=Fusarium piperis TaxID=1435070 RepID=A0A9W8W4P4_9HYPO|nr:hypothetical protein N0V84_010296 [Fusarium piperis]
MGLFLSVLEPFYDATDEDDIGTILKFKDIENYNSVKGRIVSYFEHHNVEQRYYDYKEDELMSGFGPLTED